jgi:hypothetical protein
MRDSSIVASLDELKAIHVQRLADERSAIEREREARLADQRAREQARRDAEAAEVRAAHEAELRIHTAREAAEREGRLRVAAAEASERARLDAALAAEREAGERALRRETIARQRPRWMIAVTAVALVAAIALGITAVDHERQAELAQRREAAAQLARDQAIADAQHSQEELSQLDSRLDGLHETIKVAMAQLAGAKQAEDRQAAQNAITEARRKLAEAEAARIEAKRRHDEAIRKGGIHGSERCASTVLGCMDR